MRIRTLDYMVGVYKHVLFVTEEILYSMYHDGLRLRELGQSPMLQVFLPPRQVLLSHPWRWSACIGYRIEIVGTLSIILHHFTYNEIQWSSAAQGWHLELLLQNVPFDYMDLFENRSKKQIETKSIMYRVSHMYLNDFVRLFRGHWVT